MTGVQPFVVDTVHGLLAVAHNGELVNATSLRKEVSYSFTECHIVINCAIAQI